MAGAASEDNPVGINVTALVDIIFCLCLFFMCSLHFKQLEGKIETWLPKDRGVMSAKVDKVVLEEIRVFMRWDASANTTKRKLAARGWVTNAGAAGDSELMDIVMQMRGDYEKAGKTLADIPVLIDALEDVPWRDVIHVMDMCKQRKLERIEFAAPIEIPTAPR